MFRRIFSRKPEPAPQPEPENPLVIEFMPSLLFLLIQAEQHKGSPLTDEEVLAIRDRGIAMTMARERRDAKWLAQGHRDIIAEDACNDWHRYKADPDSFNLPSHP